MTGRRTEYAAALLQARLQEGTWANMVSNVREGDKAQICFANAVPFHIPWHLGLIHAHDSASSNAPRCTQSA